MAPPRETDFDRVMEIRPYLASDARVTRDGEHITVVYTYAPDGPGAVAAWALGGGDPPRGEVLAWMRDWRVWLVGGSRCGTGPLRVSGVLAGCRVTVMAVPRASPGAAGGAR